MGGEERVESALVRSVESLGLSLSQFSSWSER